jgi:hypothetical protein
MLSATNHELIEDSISCSLRLVRKSSELVGVARYWHGLAGVARGSMARESFVHGWSGLRGLEPATPCHEAMNEAMKP